MSADLTCRYCGAQIEAAGPGERTPSSAWTAPANDDPAACTGPGHAPERARPVVTVARHDATGHETRSNLVRDRAAALAEMERLNGERDGYTYRVEGAPDA